MGTREINTNMTQENDFYPIILSAPQSDSCLMDVDDLLPIERELLEEECAMNNSQEFQRLRSTRSKSKRVSFNSMESIFLVESSEDWTDSERKSTWFKHSELKRIKKNAGKLCKLEANGVFSADESTRGMDIYFPPRKEEHAKY